MAHTQLKIHGIEGRSARTQSPQPNTRVACCWYVSKIAHASNRNTRVKKKKHTERHHNFMQKNQCDPSVSKPNQ